MQSSEAIFSVAVYCSASERIDPRYRPPAAALGRALAERGWRLVYGAGDVGLMGVVARATHEAGGKIFGVIPHALDSIEVTYHGCDELLRVETMRERKELMERAADAYVALPGGFGTLEEIVEILVLKLLNYMDRPIVFVNSNEYWSGLLTFFDRMIEERFAVPDNRHLYHVVNDPHAALDYIATYYPEPQAEPVVGDEEARRTALE